MRAVVQRVTSASVSVDDGEIPQMIARIGVGFLVLLGVALEDTDADAAWMADKLACLRVMSDAEGRMNCSLADCNGEILLVSNFTLLGDCRKGRRPAFTGAASGESAEKLYQVTAQAISKAGIPVSTGKFGAHMQVSIVNDGPVTLLLDSKRTF